MNNSATKFVPGPGNYKINDITGKEGAKFSFGKEDRGTNARPMTPGPGTYRHKLYTGSEGPKITMSGNRPSTANSSVPGVGQYQLNLNDKKKSPSFKIGTSTRDDLIKSVQRENIPGPGNYIPSHNISTRPKSPTWSMGTSTRRPLSASSFNPGPGNYNYSSTVGNGPKV